MNKDSSNWKELRAVLKEWLENKEKGMQALKNEQEKNTEENLWRSGEYRANYRIGAVKEPHNIDGAKRRAVFCFAFYFYRICL